VGCGGVSNHSPIWIELIRGPKKPASHFKFNSSWLADENFQKIFKENWIPFEQGSNIPTSIHVASNLKCIKQMVIPWAHAKHDREELELSQIEDRLEHLSKTAEGGYISMETKSYLLSLEVCLRKLLEDKEVEWHLKNRATWLNKGDENTNFFQAFMKGRNTANTIFYLNDQMGAIVSSFDGLSQLGKNHFQSLFTDYLGVNIADIIRLALLVPIFFDEEGNIDLFTEVRMEELK
jgi:hypothetical protein